MNTPILTKNQQRQSLSAKKRPAKGLSLRNILSQPFENYWPVINIDQYPTLVTLMNELLPLIKRPTLMIPGSMLRHMTKEKRTLVKKEALEKEISKPDLCMLNSVILGINAVTRALEKNHVCCILLDANVEPPLLIKHIIEMSQNKSIPVLLLPILKTITLQTIGFATAALALKHNVIQSTENKFHALYNLLADISKDFKSSKCSLFEETETFEKSTMHKEVADKSCNSISNISKSNFVTVFTNVYKHRSSRKERVFIPPNVYQDVKVSQDLSNEFIAVSSDCGSIDKNFTNIKNKRYINIYEKKESEFDSMSKNTKSFSIESKLNNSTNLLKHTESIPKKCKSNITYLPLKVKRIQGNINRTKATKLIKKKKK